jgi:hypothetical protein
MENWAQSHKELHRTSINWVGMQISENLQKDEPGIAFGADP